jgi:signal transduction histidine kinase
MHKDLTPETKQTLEIVSTAAHRVSEIVQRLLFFARQSKPMRDFVSINQLIENTLQLRAHQLKLNNIEVITRLAPNLPQVLADGGQMQQVFLNIIANAETEMNLAHGKGTLWIVSEQKDHVIEISFKDDGPGITPENMQKLFQPFFTTRALGKGTGLGLSVCHGIVTEHKGRIWADSRPGFGATFFVELPLIDQPRPP